MPHSGSLPLHVANGTSTTTTIEAAGIAGATSIWADPLYEGPVPGSVSDEELLQVRASHLSPPGGPPVDPVNDLRRWRSAIENHQAYAELVLWFEHDLFDQLTLIQLLSWIRTRLPANKAVSLVCIGSFPGRPEFKGLGELSPNELVSLLGTRQRVGAEQYSLAARAWEAFRQTTPESLDDLRRAETGALPFLAPAILRFLQEYPWTSDGLSRTERRLLKLAERGPIELRDVFPRMHEGEDTYYITDLSLAALADGLSRCSPRLLTLTGAPAAAGNPLQASVAITETGRDVVSGRRDRIELCGIDRWLGGVHLRSGADMWRWDPGHQRITRESACQR